MWKTCIFVSFVYTLFLAGCAHSIAPGINSTNISEVDFSKATFRKSTVCETWAILPFITYGEASIMEAVKQGRLKKVHIVEYSKGWYLFWGKSCVIAYGEPIRR